MTNCQVSNLHFSNYYIFYFAPTYYNCYCAPRCASSYYIPPTSLGEICSFGSKLCSKELKLKCVHIFWARLASFGYLGLISDPLIGSKFLDKTHDPKGQENKIYTIVTIVKDRETFYRRHTVSVTSFGEV